MIGRLVFALALFVPATATVPQTAPATPGEIRTEEVRFRSGEIELAGRLWLPPGPSPHPAVAFLPGSGQSIRDLQLDPDPVPFHFVEMGVAFLAWDKRGVRDSGGSFEALPDTGVEGQLAVLDRLAGDGRAAMEYLGARPDIDAGRVGVWAFSQGGWVASRLQEVGADPAFVIVVGGPAVTIGEELRYSAIADAARAASRSGVAPLIIDELYEALETARDEGADFGGYDPLASLERLTAPTLFLLGEWDLSVPTRRSIERLEALGRRHEWIDYRVFPGASHGVAARDPAGTLWMADDFYETQLDYLVNLGILDADFRFRFRFRKES